MICPTGKVKYFLAKDWTRESTDRVICPSGKSLVGKRNGESRSFRVARVTSDKLRWLVVSQVDRKLDLMTDFGGQHYRVGKEFNRHERIDHSADEYVRGDAHTSTSECRFSHTKRAVFGAHHSISEAHLPRYLAE